MEQLAHAGIEVIVGAARFKSRNVILIRLQDGEEKEIITDKVIIASGSVPIFPQNLKPDADRIIAPRLLGKMREIPASIIVIGGGVTGSEMIYLFNQLGTNVTAVTDVPTLLPRADAKVSEALEMALKSRGVIFHKNKRAASAENLGDHVKVTLEDGTELVADMAFVAIGRRPDVDGLHLANIELSTQSGIAVDAQCRTTIDGLFAAGDVTGAPMTANRAMAMARIAARNALSDHQQSYNENLTVEAVYTDPEVAQVGDASGVNAEIYAADFETNLKANIANSKNGFIKLFVHEHDHRIVGASAIGSHVSDILFSVAVAIASDMTLADFQQVVPANPTLSEVFVDLKRVE